MRLGQLARKLTISPTELINFLATNNIIAAEGSNTRLTDDQMNLVIKQFDPTGSKEIFESPAIVEQVLPEIHVPAAEVTPDPEAVELPAHAPVAEAAEPELAEVIKAQKVELSGLKVLGKIELPQPKKKEVTAVEPPVENGEGSPTPPTVSPSPIRPRQERRQNYPRTNERQAPRKNNIALQRERAAQEAAEKREEQAKLDKERRTAHYLQKVKISVPTKAVRLIDEQVIEMTDDQTTTPTTWLGKFWKWFRS